MKETTSMRHGLAMGLVLMALVGGTLNGRAGEAADKPILRIPKMTAPPTVDGKIDEKEWAGASAMTGFTSAGKLDQYPADMRAVWYLGYDDTCLYLAMHLPIPKGVTPNAQTKSVEDMDNENAILFGDHVEIQITPHSAQRAMQVGFGFYKFIVNPFDIYSDWWHMCDEPGSESAWGPGTRVKSTFDLGNWWLEMAIPIASTMKSPDGGLIKKTDGLELLVQLVNAGSCGGYSFGGWVPASWLEWDRFYKVILDPQAPVMQFLETGDLVEGKLDAQVRLRGAAGQAATVALDVLDIDGKPVFHDAKTLALKSGEWSPATFQQAALDVPPFIDTHGTAHSGKRNLARLRVEADGKVIYTADMPFTRHTPERRAATYGEYVTSLPKGDYKTKIAYIARKGTFRVMVDTDVLGNIPQAVRDAKEFRLRIAPEKGGKAVLDRKLPIVAGVGSHLLDLGPIEGVFAVTIDLLDAGGKAVSTRTHSFARVKHEWENSTIGEERAVIPPFRPIEFGDNTLKTRWSSFTVAPGGLWQGVTAFNRGILAAPMRIEGAADGKELAWEGKAVKIERGAGRAFPPEFDQFAFLSRDCPKIPFEKLPETDGYEANITGQGALGPVAVDIKATMDYDGYTRFLLTYAPAAGMPVKLDRLEVVLDLFPGINGMSMARESIPHALTLPADRRGVQWESASYKTKSPAFRGNFVPLLHLGDGTHGLQFIAASDEGWLLNDDVSCMKVERHDKTVRLRLLLVNAPATLDKARTVDFVLRPLPVKDAPQGYRHFIWGGPNRDYVHHSFGWRKYGTGADNWYLPSDEEYGKLGELIRAGKSGGGGKLAWTAPVMMYSSFPAVGSPLPDCDSFRGQWFKNSEYKDRGAVEGDGKYKSPTGHPYDKPECFTESRPWGWDEDLRDNYMWFHRKLVALTESNGTYWDNSEITHFLNLDAGEYGYLRDDGKPQPTNDSYHKRWLQKRLYTMGWLEGKPPLYNSKFAWNAPFADINNAVEGHWYIYTEDGTWFDNFEKTLSILRFFRSSHHLPTTIGASDHRQQFDTTAKRSYLTLAILHDLGIIQVDRERSELLRRIDDEIGFLDKTRQAEFIPYWSPNNPVSFVRWSGQRGQETWSTWQPEGVFVSMFRSQTLKGKAMLWFVNANNESVTTGLRMNPRAVTGRSRTETVFRDLETGSQLNKALPAAVVAEQDKEMLWSNIVLPPKTFIALIAEPGIDDMGKVWRPWP